MSLVPRLGLTAVMTGLLIAGAAADTFRRLNGAQIQARFAGMDMSDGVHWRDSYARDGTLQSQSMGKRRAGKWHVENNQLCVNFGVDSGGCYEVWLEGSKVEFRREGLEGAILDGELMKPAAGSRAAK